MSASEFFYNGEIQGHEFIIDNNNILTTIVATSTANRIITFPNSSGTSSVGAGGVSYASWYRQGTQPAALSVGQPLTYTTLTANTISGLSMSTGVYNPPFTNSGSVFTMPVGTFRISWEQVITESGAATNLLFGSTIAGMVVIPNSSVGQATGNAQSTGNYILIVPGGGGFLAVAASAGNAGAVNIAGTQNGNSTITTINITKLA